MIPQHLQSLPLHDGLPVTATSRWSDESHPYVDFDPLISTTAIFVGGERGKGEPLVGQTHPVRQRLSVVNGTCQVCERVINAPRLLADLRIGTQSFRFDGGLVPLVVDSWTCDECMAYSLKACPGLKRLQPIIMHVREWVLVPTPERPKWITSDMIPYGPVGYVKIAPIVYEQVS